MTEMPEKRFQRGACSVSIFVNEIEKAGQVYRIPKAVFQKRFKGDDGKWRSTASLDTNDIPRAVLCLQEAFAHLTQSSNGSDRDETE
jgi:hypothetical protein